MAQESLWLKETMLRGEVTTECSVGYQAKPWLPYKQRGRAKRRVLRADLSRMNVSKAVNSNYSPDCFLDLEAYLTQVLSNKHPRHKKCFMPRLTERSQMDPCEQASLAVYRLVLQECPALGIVR